MEGDFLKHFVKDRTLHFEKRKYRIVKGAGGDVREITIPSNDKALIRQLRLLSGAKETSFNRAVEAAISEMGNTPRGSHDGGLLWQMRVLTEPSFGIMDSLSLDHRTDCSVIEIHDLGGGTVDVKYSSEADIQSKPYGLKGIRLGSFSMQHVLRVGKEENGHRIQSIRISDPVFEWDSSRIHPFVSLIEWPNLEQKFIEDDQFDPTQFGN